MKCEDKRVIAPLYENIDVFYKNGGADDVSGFPLDLPTKALEPPKEKPPPPPVEETEDELLGNVSCLEYYMSQTSTSNVIERFYLNY